MADVGISARDRGLTETGRLPFRLVGIAVGGVLAFFKEILRLPARILRGPAGFRA